MRELFISDATDVYPVSVLRGKCTVHHCQVTNFRVQVFFPPNIMGCFILMFVFLPQLTLKRQFFSSPVIFYICKLSSLLQDSLIRIKTSITYCILGYQSREGVCAKKGYFLLHALVQSRNTAIGINSRRNQGRSISSGKNIIKIDLDMIVALL